MKNKILILGVGNTLRRDDGIGPRVIEGVKSSLSKTGSIKNASGIVDSEDLTPVAIDGGIDGLSLIDVIQQYSHAIIIDAVDMGAAPATIRVFTPESAVINIRNDTLSTHGFGLAEVIKLLPELGIFTKLTIIGVQPSDVSFGEGLSDVVAAKMDTLVALTQEEAAALLLTSM